ncbi:MAG: fumarylacetoacetate hydrolase family protein [Pseudomonadota bacterium]
MLTLSTLSTVALVLTIIAIAGAIYTWRVSKPLFTERYDDDTAQIVADANVALTFARSADALIRVLAHDGDTVHGINLTAAFGTERTADLIALYEELGYDGLAAVEAEAVTVHTADLGQPVDYRYPYVAVGTNYAEHAEEVMVDDPPFLFPKLARASAWNAQVPFTKRLDYEIELGVVPLRDIRSATDDVPFGLVLCNDYTDRWTLVRQLKFKEPMGTTGFADAKGKSGFLPTGYLFVIPKSRDYLNGLQHRLWLNGGLRQRFTAGEMILKVEEIVTQTLELKDRPHQSQNGPVPLLHQDTIPAGTLILTGTAAGVIFKPANIWLQTIYLQKNDVVRAQADGLGQLLNRIH